jgi:two-component system sensor histidine kinase PilS (NtrC family)
MPYKQSNLHTTILAQSTSRAWLPLQLFNFYRIILASLFLILYITDLSPNFFGGYDEQLFITVIVVYLLFGINMAFVISKRWFTFDIQVMSQCIVDIIMIILIMHSSGGLSSGLGVLLIITIAGSSILTIGKNALFFAAIASLAILFESVFDDIYNIFLYTHYTRAGTLGASFFATAFLAHILSIRLRASDAKALHLVELNLQIVKHFKSGIIVINNKNYIELINNKAIKLLGIKNKKNSNLGSLAPELIQQLKLWNKSKNYDSYMFSPNAGEVDVTAVFSQLNQSNIASTIIFLEDASLLAKYAEQLKLASLGRLSASIAHEIRNPLGAISHAAQLLAESKTLSKQETRLNQIILERSKLINTIIENILQLGREHCKPVSNSFDLEKWLNEFVTEINAHYNLDKNQIIIKNKCNKVIKISFSIEQLHQILWNILENALRHSTNKIPCVELIINKNLETQHLYLDIQDFGNGIDKSIQNKIFEPFFTTEHSGNGLGLYIARELCLYSNANLKLFKNDNIGSCFRINYAYSSGLNIAASIIDHK